MPLAPPKHQVTDFSSLAVPLSSQTGGWENLQQARKRRGIDVGLINAVRSGQLMIAQSDEIPRYNGLMVSIAEVDNLLAGQNKRLSQSPELLGTVSAAVFGRSVGLRNGGHFLTLIDAGHVDAHAVIHPHTKKVQYRMTDSHIAAFRRKFLTLSIIEEEFGVIPPF